MPFSDGELPLDSPVFVVSDNEFVTEDMFAKLTSVGWGAAASFLAPGTSLRSALPSGCTINDLAIVVHVEAIDSLATVVHGFIDEGALSDQIVVAGPASSTLHRTLATGLRLAYLNFDLRKTAIGPKIVADDVVKTVSNRIHARLTALVDEEVRIAASTGSLLPIPTPHSYPVIEPTELATMASMIATKISSLLSFRRRVIRTALFRGIIELDGWSTTATSAIHLSDISTTLNGVDAGVSATNAGVCLSFPIPLESWCVIAAEQIIKNPAAALKSLQLVICAADIETRAALKESITYALTTAQRWAHASAS